jgi:hypothetical protein
MSYVSKVHPVYIWDWDAGNWWDQKDQLWQSIELDVSIIGFDVPIIGFDVSIRKV